MAKLAMIFGVLVALVGIAGYIATHFWHALIPVVLGFLLVLFGLVANTDDVKRRMLSMHIAVTVALLGFLGTIPGLIAMVRFLTGTHQETPSEQIEVGTLSVHKLAATVQSATNVLCLIFVLLCVRSFIVARRGRA